MESSDEETDSGALGPAYSLTDMLDELGSDSTSGVTSPVPSEGLASPSHQPKEKSVTSTDTTTTTNTATTAPPAPPEGTTCTTPKGQGQPEVQVTDGGAPTAVVDPSKTSTKDQTQDSVSVEDTTRTTCTEEISSKKDTHVGVEKSEKSESSLSTVKKEQDRSSEKTNSLKGGVEKSEQVDNMKDKQALSSPINGNISDEKKKSLTRQNDLNGNAKTAKDDSKIDEELQSDELSDEAIQSKDDPVWKRKKVIKRRKPKKSLTSQSSTGSDDCEGSTSSIGSVNGVVIHPLENKAVTPDRETLPAGCDKMKTNEIYPVHESQDNITNENIENEEKNDTSKDVVTNTEHKPGNAQETQGADCAQGETGTTQSGTGTDQTGYTQMDEFSGYEQYDFRSQGKSHRGPNEEDIYCNVPDSAIYENLVGRSDPRRSTLRRGATLRGLSVEDLASMTYQGSMKLIKVLPDEHPTKSNESLTGKSYRHSLFLPMFVFFF